MAEHFMDKSDHILKNETVYDSVFWTSVNMLTRYLIPLVNEAFGERFTENASITLKPGKQVTELTNGSLRRRELDSLARVSEAFSSPTDPGPGELVERDYHFECEASGGSTVALRIVEYASGYAFQNPVLTKDGAELVIPYSAVIFLRPPAGVTDHLRIRIRYPGGIAHYDVPALRMQDYTVEDLFDKGLLLLVPFSIFLFGDKELREMDTQTESLSKLEGMLDTINARLQEMVSDRQIDAVQRGNLLRYTDRVIAKAAAKYQNVRKGAERIMGGYIIRTDIDAYVEKGRIEGERAGQIKGENKLSRLMQILLDSGRNDDARKAASDEKVRQRLYEEFQIV